jgi:Zn-dependent protease with chaperone function
MAPLQVILLLLLIRAPAILNTTEGGGGSQDVSLGIPGLAHFPAAFVVLSFLLSHLFLVMIVTQRARVAVRMLHLPTTNAAAVSSRMDHLFATARWATLLLTAIHLYALQLPLIVQGWLATTHLFKYLPLLPETLYLAPAFLAWLGFWTANYQIERAIRERSFPYRLAMGMPAHEMPPLSHYLSMQVRHNFYLILLVGLSSLIEDLGERLDPYIPHASDVGTPVAIIVVLAMVPWLITRVWSTVPLQGPLRTRLDRLAAHYRLRFRNILIWKTHNHITNAAILGWVPFSRYFLMTDALLETLTDQQIEAVFAHEVGHGVHKHILWYLVAVVGAWTLCVGIASLGGYYLPLSITTHLTAWTGHPQAAEAGCGLLLMFLFFTFGFSFFSHRFEHQADWFAAKHMGQLLAQHPESLPMPALVLTKQGEELPQTLEQTSVAEAVTLDQYLAGHYPNAVTTDNPNVETPHVARSPSAVISEAASTAASEILDHTHIHPPIKTTPATAGAEVFISSLDTIMELAHRSRNKRGWMHPSIDNRVALLRALAANTQAAAAFNRRMITTRLMIALLAVVGGAALYISMKLPEKTHPGKPASPPMQVDPSGKEFIL